ncbi:hypothetical protein BDB01DRAFT_780302 [Pilobolus umbonatus]|nr:hypothetical protein BDB01DRAFT_780302 [Pilobolus umbonatus]
MDDMYQYAASAVNNNNKDKEPNVPEEQDVILNAFNHMGWGRKWSRLVDTVKKQSEAFVEGTKKDLQEFAQVLTEDASDNEERSTREVHTTDESEITPIQSIKESLSKINAVNFNTLKEGLVSTLNHNLPQQMMNVKLPENMDLTQLKEELSTGTKSAEQYLQKFGSDVLSALKHTITVVSPEEEVDQTTETTLPTHPRVFANRKDALISKMQVNDDTYLKPLEFDQEEDKKVADTFCSSFKIDEYTFEIAELLNEYPELRQTMDRLVPVQISYPLFWQRYFYHVWKIEQDEKKRELIVKGVEEDEADFKWDSDEEETINPVKTLEGSSSDKTVNQGDIKEHDSKKRVSTSNQSEDTDFSHLSEPISTEASMISAAHTEEDWITADKKRSDIEDDSDSDWE